MKVHNRQSNKQVFLLACNFFYSAVIANERERFLTDNSGEIALKNAVAVNEIPSQDIENELYMLQSGDACSISPQNRKCGVFALEPDHSRC